MFALGIDPSLLAYGWAVHDDMASGMRRRVESAHVGTLPSTVPVARFMHFQAMVEELLDRHDVDVVGIESPAYQAGPFQSIHFGLMMFSMVPIFNRRKDVVLFDPATLKYLAKEDPARKSPMGKMDMQRKVQLDTMDPNVINDNEADAYLCAKFAARMMNLVDGKLDPRELTGCERRVFLERQKTVKRMGQKVKRKISHAFRENSRFFRFSQVPPGEVLLPKKAAIRPELLDFLEELEEESEAKAGKKMSVKGDTPLL